MQPIPEDAIEDIPDIIEEETIDACQQAVDASLLVLFLYEAESYPPVLSNGVEVYPLPAPWTEQERDKDKLLFFLNGSESDPGFLAYIKRNAHAYNEALEKDVLPEAKRIFEQAPADSAHIWNSCNALAMSYTTGKIFRPLVLSDETKEAFEALSL